LGVVPAIIIWLAAFTLLGVVVGVPVLATLNHVQHLAVTGVVLVLIGVVTVIGVRYIPSIEQLEGPLINLSRPLSVAVSIVIDLAIVTTFASGTTELLHLWLDLEGVITFSVVTAVVILIYVSVARRIIGGTAGERLTSVRYAAK
jgi:hypothetical protein